MDINKIQEKLGIIPEENSMEFVGYHCSNEEDLSDGFYGDIQDEYVIQEYNDVNYLRDLLQIVTSGKYKEDFFNQIKEHNEWANEAEEYDFVIDVNNLPDEYDEKYNPIAEELVRMINDYYNWIFVNQQHPLKEYGEYCYEVYFNDMGKTHHIHDKVHYGADIYVYEKNNPPILKPYSENIDEAVVSDIFQLMFEQGYFKSKADT
jgi:hypothetical protein